MPAMLLINPFRKVVGQDADIADVAGFSPAVAQRVVKLDCTNCQS